MSPVERIGCEGPMLAAARRVCLDSARVVAFLLLAAPMHAHQGNQQAGNAVEQSTAPVVVDSRVLFRVRGISAYPAEERARTIAARIAAVASDRTFPVEDLRVVESENQTEILAADRLIMGVFDADATLEGVRRPVLVQFCRGKIAEAIQAYRHERDPRVLASKVLYGAVATVASIALVFLILRLSRRLESAVQARYLSRMQGLRIQTFQLVQAEKVWTAVRGAVHMARALALLAVFLVYAQYVLGLFPWTRQLSKRGLALVLDPLRSMGASILAAVPGLAFIAVLVVVVRYVLKLSRLFFAGLESGTVTLSGFEKDWSWPTYKIFRLLIIAFAVVVAYPYVPGSTSDAFKGVSIFIGVIFSLGSTSVVSNTIAGYAMTYRRAFRVGDRVQIGEHVGDVEAIRLQVTHLRTLKNEEVIIPNSVILNSHVINYSSLARNSGLILHTTVGIGYETPWRQVESMLLMAADRTPGLLREPPPFVLQKALGDFCVTYEINVYSDRPQNSLQLYTALHRNILDVFNEYRVQIMTPAYEGDPEQPKVVPRDKWYESPAPPPEPDAQP